MFILFFREQKFQNRLHIHDSFNCDVGPFHHCISVYDLIQVWLSVVSLPTQFHSITSICTLLLSSPKTHYHSFRHLQNHKLTISITLLYEHYRIYLTVDHKVASQSSFTSSKGPMINIYNQVKEQPLEMMMFFHPIYLHHFGHSLLKARLNGFQYTETHIKHLLAKNFDDEIIFKAFLNFFVDANQARTPRRDNLQRNIINLALLILNKNIEYSIAFLVSICIEMWCQLHDVVFRKRSYDGQAHHLEMGNAKLRLIPPLESELFDLEFRVGHLVGQDICQASMNIPLAQKFSLEWVFSLRSIDSPRSRKNIVLYLSDKSH